MLCGTLFRQMGIWIAIAFAATLWAADAKYELPAGQRTGVIRKLFVVSHTHLDIGFTRSPDQVARDYQANIDLAIRLAAANSDFRWSIESAWMLEEWLRRTDDPALIEQLGALMRAGRISLGAAFANMHSGLMAPEESNRLVYAGERFRRQFGAAGLTAFQNDVPGFSWAYPRILAGSGVEYLVTGLNLFIGGGNNLGPGKNPFYWVGPDGSRVLTWFASDSYVEGYRWKINARWPLADMEVTVPRRLAWLERNGYRYDASLVMASTGDNADPAAALQMLVKLRAWNQRHPELEMRMATPEEFFAYLTGKYGDSFPEVRGDAAGHWEVRKINTPAAASKLRATSNLLPVAEMAATIASLVGGDPFPRFDFAEAWRDLLIFHEHTTGAGAGWPGYWSRQETDWSNAVHYVWSLTAYSNTEQQYRRALDELSRASVVSDPSLQAPAEGAATLMVFNGLSWKRSGPVLADRLPQNLREGPLEVNDLVTGTQLPYEDVSGTRRHIVFFAPEIPSAGWRAFSVKKAAAPVPGDRSRPFQVDVRCDDSGNIVSVRDVATGRELIAESPALSFGTLLISRDGGVFQHASTPAQPAQVTITEGGFDRRTSIRRPASALPLVEVTVYRGARYADLRFDLDMSVLRATADRRLQYAVALPLAGSRTSVDGAGFVLRVPEDLLPGGAAPQRVPVHFIHVEQQPGSGVTLANIDAFAMRPEGLWLLAGDELKVETRDQGLQPLEVTEPHGSALQTFRFRIGWQEQDASAWERFGVEANTPLQAVPVSSAGMAAQKSFFEISSQAVQLLAFKPAEARPGWYVLRLQEVAGKESSHVKLTSPLHLGDAMLANLVEVPLNEKVDLGNLTLRPWETLTVLVKASPQ